MTWLLRSPFSRPLDRSVMLITVRGRRTGAEYTLPVQYARGEKAIWVIAARHERKTWWRNLLREGPVVLRVRGHELNGRAQALTGESAPAEVEQGLRTYFRRFPGLARRYRIVGKGGSIDAGLLRDLAKRTVIVRVVPGQEDAFWSVGSTVPAADPEARSGRRVKPGTPGHVATAPTAAMVPGQGDPAGAKRGHAMRWRESSRFLRNVFLLILAAVFVSLHVAHAVIVYRK
jgi:deazaflavin-dependent oxidoreductase (nitroreductase family)